MALPQPPRHVGTRHGGDRLHRRLASHASTACNGKPERRLLSFVGLGNSQMLYPEPKDKEQSEANRRVEVKIVSN